MTLQSRKSTLRGCTAVVISSFHFCYVLARDCFAQRFIPRVSMARPPGSAPDPPPPKTRPLRAVYISNTANHGQASTLKPRIGAAPMHSRLLAGRVCILDRTGHRHAASQRGRS